MINISKTLALMANKDENSDIFHRQND